MDTFLILLSSERQFLMVMHLALMPPSATAITIAFLVNIGKAVSNPQFPIVILIHFHFVFYTSISTALVDLRRSDVGVSVELWRHSPSCRSSRSQSSTPKLGEGRQKLGLSRARARCIKRCVISPVSHILVSPSFRLEVDTALVMVRAGGNEVRILSGRSPLTPILIFVPRSTQFELGRNNCKVGHFVVEIPAQRQMH